MRLTRSELATVQAVLEKIDTDFAEPQLPDRLGLFFRQYRSGREQLKRLFTSREIEVRATGALSGQRLGAVEIHPLTQPVVRVQGFPLGEVADTTAISEELGGITHVTTWLEGPVANAVFNLLCSQSAIRTEGDYRWTPPSRWTPGEARIAPVAPVLRWQDARCIKAVSDDIDRPPHALEYIADFQFGFPGLKFFRSICIVHGAAGAYALPCLGTPRLLRLEETSSHHLTELRKGTVALCLVYREPWNDSWTIVKAVDTDESTVFAHAVSWADFQRELDGSRVDGSTVRSIRHALGSEPATGSRSAEPNIEQRLLPVAREMLRLLRGLA